MPTVKALKSFRGRYGMIRAGSIFNCEPGYAESLRKNKLIEVIDGAADEKRQEPGPEANRKKPDPPGRAGKDQPGEQGERRDATVPPLAGGLALTSASLRADLASRKTTSTKSAAGAKKAKPVPAKGKKKTSSTRASAPPPPAT